MMKSFEIPVVGYSVEADWYEGSNPEKVLLSLIGWTSAKAKYRKMLPQIVEETGMSVLTFDYSGHGDEAQVDVQETRPAQHFLEVICVFDQLREQHPTAEICVMGTSYGGFLATQLTKYRKFEKLVLRVPAIYRPEDFYTQAKKRDQQRSDAYRHDKAALGESPLLARAQMPTGTSLVVVHGEDELIPAATTDAYILALQAEVIVAEGFRHSFDGISEEAKRQYITRLSDWLKK